MVNPQLKNGYVKIANQVLDALVRTRIPGRQRQILDFIIRKTWGYRKESDWISLSQMSKATGIAKRHVWQELSRLVAKKMVKRIGTENGVRKRPKYMFNKNFEEWKNDTVSAEFPNSGPCGTENSVKIDTENGAHKRQEDNNTKERGRAPKGAPLSSQNEKSNLDIPSGVKIDEGPTW